MNKLKSISNFKKRLENFILRNAKYSSEAGCYECCEPKIQPVMRNPTIDCVKQGPPQCLQLTDPSCPCAASSACFPKVFIIGAGIAGLSAAMRLINCGFEDVTIFEATERCGGRIRTTWMNDAVIELGPDRIQGACMANPAFTLACIEGLFDNRLPERINNNFYDVTSDGRVVNEPKSQDMVIRQLLNDLYKLLKRGHSAPDISLLHYLKLNTDQVLLTLPSSLKYEAQRMFSGLIQSVKAEFGTELDKVSSFGYGQLPKLPGGDISIPCGFNNLLAPLIRDIPSEYIRFNKAVREIQWSQVPSKPNVVITTIDHEQFAADFAIITLPLGVLKEIYCCLFVPSLPEAKVQAIKALGVGHINYVYLDYAERWWANNECQIRIAWHDDDFAQWPNWIKGISTISQVSGSEHIIALKLGGEEAILVEEMTPEEIAVDFTNFIRSVMHNSLIQFPNNVLTSKWSHNPYFYGAKSYLKLGSTIGHIRDLSEPGINVSSILDIPPILFAGEHTHPSYFGTMHGARLSGIREANRILEYTKAMLSCGTCSQQTANPCQEACA